MCLLEYEEENGKPVPPQFEYFHDGRLLSACNLHLDVSWGYQGVEGDPATASRLQEPLTAAGLPAQEQDDRRCTAPPWASSRSASGLCCPGTRS